MNYVKLVLTQITQRQDLAIVLLLVTSIVLMILPLPTLLVDLFLATNMALTVLLLMVSVYLKNPLQLSMLPSIILLMTVFRLSLSIATTRLILLNADAGHIVRTFGEFVVAGNLIVGLVIFLIITIVQFVVITKGSERVAEVSARFTLDALPGKQMSIDAELRSGEIDQDAARQKRHELEKESQLYGAMDGAMKFVKGDAIAGLIIIAVNLLGGLAVGTLQHDMPMGEALHVYSVLTIGDGLVAQIPALLMSLTAGAVVTRVTTDDSENLGADIVGQLVSEPRAAIAAAALLVGLAFVPGFPVAVFLTLAGIMGAVGIVLHRRNKRAGLPDVAEPEDDSVLDTVEATPASVDRVALVLGQECETVLDVATLRERLRRIPDAIEADLGIPIPAVRLLRDGALASNHARIDLEGVPILEIELPEDRFCVLEREEHLKLAGVEAAAGPALLSRTPAFWVEDRYRPAVEDAGFPILGPEAVIADRLEQTLRRNAAQFLGLQETQAILQEAEKNHRDLVREVQKSLPLQRMAEVFRRLVDEGVSIKPQRLLLEALLDLLQREQDVVMLAEYLRTALARQICHAAADPNKVVAAFLMERSLEDVLRQSVKQTSVGSHLALPDRTRRRLLDLIKLHEKRAQASQVRPVVLTSLDIRRHVRQLLVRNDVHIAVMAHNEIARDFSVQPVATLRLTGATADQPAGPGGSALAAAALAGLLIATLPLAAAAQPATARPGYDWSGGTAAGEQLMRLTVGRGELIRFAEPVRTVLVANPRVADVSLVSDRAVYVFGVAVGRTNLFVLGPDESIRQTSVVEVGRDGPALTSRAREVAGAQVIGSYVGARPAFTGSVAGVDDAMRLATLGRQEAGPDQTALDLARYPASQQINLRVRFAEVSRSALNNLGINWRTTFDIRGATFQLLQGVFTGGPIGAITSQAFGAATASGKVDVILEALQRQGVLTVLAEPNLTTVSGKPASFLAGGEFPIPVPQSLDAITVQYRQFGVMLNFLPTVLPDQRLAIEVNPEVSALDPATGIVLDGFSIPGITVRRTQTTVELASGQTFAIAGLLDRRESRTIDQLPLLGNIPILGNLFRSVSFQAQESELVVLITPYLVEPTAVADYAAPGERGPALRPAPGDAASTPPGPGVGFLLD